MGRAMQSTNGVKARGASGYNRIFSLHIAFISFRKGPMCWSAQSTSGVKARGASGDSKDTGAADRAAGRVDKLTDDKTLVP